MTTYRTTWTKGMNTRPLPNVNNSPNGTVAYGAPPVKVLEVFNVTVATATAKIGDQWVRISDAPQWVAVKHMGVVYGVLENDTPPTDPPPSVGFPQSYILTNDDPAHPEYGKRAEYQFVRVVD